VSKQNLNPFHWHFWGIKNHQKKIFLKKLWHPKVKGSKTQKNKSPNATKASSQTPKKIFEYYSIVIKVPR